MAYERMPRIRVAICCAAIGLTIGACGGESPTKQGVSVSASRSTPTPTTTRSAHAARPSASASAASDRELYDATKNFYATIHQAYRKLDPAPIERLVAPGSNAASGYLGTIADLRKHGYHFDHLSPYEITEFHALSAPPGVSERSVEFVIAASDPSTVADGTGRIVDRVGDGPATHAAITFVRRNGHWLVSEQDVDHPS